MNKNVYILLITIINILLGCAANTGDPHTRKPITKEIINITYTTITEGFDWGPAITKVVIDVNAEVTTERIDVNAFTVRSVRTFKNFDYGTHTEAPVATAHESARNIVAAYASDAEGQRTSVGKFITLELEVGPNLPQGSPFNYQGNTGFNVYVDTYYKISMSASKIFAHGDSVTIEETGKSEYAGNISLLADTFENNIPFTHEAIALRYASFMPTTAQLGKTPLIIWLHGAGEGGTNTYITLLGNKVTALATHTIQQFFGQTGAAILAPQSPTIWMDANGDKTYNSTVAGNTGESYYTEALMKLIEDYISTHPEIDTSRIYIGGCSNGGYMTMNMLMTYPHYFAAAYPIATPYMPHWLTDEKIFSIKNIPIWFTHAKTDGVVPVTQGSLAADYVTYILDADTNGATIPLQQNSTLLFNALQEAQAPDVHYCLFDKVEDATGRYFKNDGVTPFEYMGHFSWIYTLNNECEEKINTVNVSLFEWLASKSKHP